MRSMLIVGDRQKRLRCQRPAEGYPSTEPVPLTLPYRRSGDASADGGLRMGECATSTIEGALSLDG